MTALHLMAQYLLKGNHTIATREGEVSYSNGIIEYIIPDSRYEADVAGDKGDGAKFLIEIFVKHKLEDQSDKVKYIQAQKIHAIEIDLSNADPDIDKDKLLVLLLNEIHLQRVIFSPQKEVAYEPQQTLLNPVVKTRELSPVERLVIAGIVGVIFWAIIGKVKSLFETKKRRYH